MYIPSRRFHKELQWETHDITINAPLLFFFTNQDKANGNSEKNNVTSSCFPLLLTSNMSYLFQISMQSGIAVASLSLEKQMRQLHLYFPVIIITVLGPSHTGGKFNCNQFRIPTPFFKFVSKLNSLEALGSCLIPGASNFIGTSAVWSR